MPNRDTINQHTRVCISVAARPSSIGTRFHNFLYDELGLDYLYKAFAAEDIAAVIQGVRALGIRGVSVSMPFKEQVIDLVDELAPSAAALGAANTVVNTDGVLRAANTDVEAVAEVIGEHWFSKAGIDSATPVVVRGAGGMARAVVAAFNAVGTTNLTVIARRREAAEALAVANGYAPSAARSDLDPVQVSGALLVNATPIGMAGADEDRLAFSAAEIEGAVGVVDVVALPSETPTVLHAREHGVSVITGAEVIAAQAARQFEIYTGVRPTGDQVRRASEFSRQAHAASQ